MKLLLIPIFVLTFGFAGAGVGWVVGTRALHTFEFDPLEEATQRRNSMRAQYRRRKLRRLFFTLLSFLLGVLAGLAFLFYLAKRG